MTTETKTGTVFIIQESVGKNLLSARNFGNVEVLLPPGAQVTFSAAPTVATLHRKLRDFSDDDILLLTGDPIAIGMATAIAASYNGGRVKFLKWDRETSSYFQVSAELA